MPPQKSKTRSGVRWRFVRTINGNRKWSRYVFLTSREAAEAEAKYVMAVLEGRNVTPSDFEPTSIESVQQLLARRVEWLRLNKSEKHAYDTEFCFKRAMNFVPEWLDLPADRITEEMVIQLKEKWGNDLRGRGKSMADCIKGFTYLQAAWNGPWDSRRARREYPLNPFSHVDRYAGTKKVKDVPTVEEMNEILAAVKEPEKKLYIDILHATGARPGEGVKLKKKDVILEEPYGLILWTKKKKGGVLTPRRMGIPDDLALRIEHWMEDHPDQIYLFQQEGVEKPRVDRWIANLQAAACRTAKVRHFTPHSYRHFYASKLAKEGYSIPQIQYLLGHENSMTTEKYIHDLMGAPAIPKEVLV